MRTSAAKEWFRYQSRFLQNIFIFQKGYFSHLQLYIHQGVSAVGAFYELLSQSSLSVLHPEENKPVAPVELCPILKTLYKILITRWFPNWTKKIWIPAFIYKVGRVRYAPKCVQVPCVPLTTLLNKQSMKSNTKFVAYFGIQGAVFACNSASAEGWNLKWSAGTHWDCTEPCFLQAFTSQPAMNVLQILWSSNWGTYDYTHRSNCQMKHATETYWFLWWINCALPSTVL